MADKIVIGRNICMPVSGPERVSYNPGMGKRALTEALHNPDLNDPHALAAKVSESVDTRRAQGRAISYAEAAQHIMDGGRQTTKGTKT